MTYFCVLVAGAIGGLLTLSGLASSTSGQKGCESRCEKVLGPRFTPKRLKGDEQPEPILMAVRPYGERARGELY